MNVGFEIVERFPNGNIAVKPIKMHADGPTIAKDVFILKIDGNGRLLKVCYDRPKFFSAADVVAPVKTPINFREPCQYHLAKLAKVAKYRPLSIQGMYTVELLGRRITPKVFNSAETVTSRGIQHALMAGELYRLARDLHRVDNRLADTPGYNFELVMDAITNGSDGLRFTNEDGFDMTAFFVIGTDWVKTVNVLETLNFGIGVVETSFVEYFKSVTRPYIEYGAYNE